MLDNESIIEFQGKILRRRQEGFEVFYQPFDDARRWYATKHQASVRTHTLGRSEVLRG